MSDPRTCRCERQGTSSNSIQHYRKSWSNKIYDNEKNYGKLIFIGNKGVCDKVKICIRQYLVVYCMLSLIPTVFFKCFCFAAH